MERKTPLYDCHVALGGKIVPFGGFLLPVQYPTGVIAEHLAVRKEAGMFDVSHMAELLLKGPDALANVQMLLTNDFIDRSRSHAISQWLLHRIFLLLVFTSLNYIIFSKMPRKNSLLLFCFHSLSN